jgi:hypothetical protein
MICASVDTPPEVQRTVLGRSVWDRSNLADRSQTDVESVTGRYNETKYSRVLY